MAGPEAMDAAAPRSPEHLINALAGVAARDRAALGVVYRDTCAKLFGVCLRILGDRQEAEDVLQEVYVTVWDKAGGFDPAKASAITWLVTIARNRSIDRLRGAGAAMRRRSDPLDAAQDIGDPAPDAHAVLEKSDLYQRLADCLDGLSVRQAQNIRAAFLDGLTYDQLASRHAIPLATMKSVIRRGLLRLRACLDQ